jgi:hypothetical protein
MNTEKLLKKCRECLNKTFNYDNGLVYEHGRPVSITVTKVERDQVFAGVLVYNQMTFTDGYTSAPNSYCIGGEHFLNMTKQKRITTNCKSNQ